MGPKKKNQHYIPKFYLKQFSVENNLKEISLFNTINNIYIKRAPIKTQGSKNFYYGVDGALENELSEIEGLLAATLKGISENLIIPPKDSEMYISLLAFISITHLRNPISIEGKKKSFQAVREKIIELSPETDIDKLIPNVSHDKALELSFGMVADIIQMLSDLDVKILINKTNIPFITSDNPIVKYNQFLEERKWHGSKTGFGLVGLQIFVPLNQSITLVFFDSSIYKVGNKKQTKIEMNRNDEIQQLNLLQYLNCIDTIYFNQNFNEYQARAMFETSKKYSKANISKATLAKLIDPKETNPMDKDNFIIMQNSDCDIKLTLSNFKIHFRGRSHKLNPSMAQVRPHCEKLRGNRD